ncbi:hypothetical protein BV20DRAFT_960023 [Pilatotrama ljubarskyi]|nr:hypothetical protein BV20DRAFT_960023 [Pilatotrama ljubarskyi]
MAAISPYPIAILVPPCCGRRAAASTSTRTELQPQEVRWPSRLRCGLHCRGSAEGPIPGVIFHTRTRESSSLRAESSRRTGRSSGIRKPVVRELEARARAIRARSPEENSRRS